MAILGEKLRSYFLGELSADEAARLENEYLGDDAKFTELRGAENDLLDDYIRQKLPPQIRKSFEENYLNSPFRKQRLQFAQTLAEYLQINSKPMQTVESRRFIWSDVFSFWNISLATASILLAVIGGIWLFNSSQPLPNNDVAVIETPIVLPTETPQIVPTIEKTPTKPKANQSEINTNISPTPKPIISPTPNEIKPNQTIVLALSGVGLRDGGKTPQAIIGKETKNVILQLNLGETTAQSFQVKIINVDGNTVYQIPNAKRNGKRINLNLSANLLKNDDYIVEILSMNEAGESEKVSSYSFRILKK